MIVSNGTVHYAVLTPKVLTVLNPTHVERLRKQNIFPDCHFSPMYFSVWGKTQKTALLL